MKVEENSAMLAWGIQRFAIMCNGKKGTINRWNVVTTLGEASRNLLLL